MVFLGFEKPIEEVMEIEIDLSTTSNKSIKSGIERMLELGRELLQMSLRLEKKHLNESVNSQNRKTMEVWNQLNLIFETNLIYCF